jgi:hypothetical protein
MIGHWRLFAGFILLLAASGIAQAQETKPGVARITGRAVHPDGTPAMAVEIEAVDKGNPSFVAIVSRTDGSFAAERLPAGRYRVGVDLGINRQPDEAYGRTYFPGVNDPAKAAEIEIASGSPDPQVLFILPKMRPPVQLRGRVVYADGTGAAGVDVFFKPVGGYSVAQVWADANGEYKETKYGAVSYRIQAKSRDAKYESAVQVLEPADLEKPILLVLRQTSPEKPQPPQ